MENWKKYLSALWDGTKIYIVDGSYVRDNFNETWYGGGHGWIDTFTPKDEIWVEAMIDFDDTMSFIVHEVSEWYKMKYEGMTYDNAHDKANKREREMRRIRSIVKNKSKLTGGIMKLELDAKKLKSDVIAALDTLKKSGDQAATPRNIWRVLVATAGYQKLPASKMSEILERIGFKISQAKYYEPTGGQVLTKSITREIIGVLAASDNMDLAVAFSKSCKATASSGYRFVFKDKGDAEKFSKKFGPKGASVVGDRQTGFIVVVDSDGKFREHDKEAREFRSFKESSDSLTKRSHSADVGVGPNEESKKEPLREQLEVEPDGSGKEIIREQVSITKANLHEAVGILICAGRKDLAHELATSAQKRRKVGKSYKKAPTLTEQQKRERAKYQKEYRRKHRK